MAACISIDLKSVRKFGELDKRLTALRDSPKSSACNLSVVSAGEVALGLLEATPAVGEQQVPGKGQRISRIFFPLPTGTLFNTNLKYEIEMQVGPPTLQRDFDLKGPANSKQAILEGGVLQFQEWNYDLTPRHQFDKQDLIFNASATASVLDPQTKLPLRSKTGAIPVPLNTVKLIPTVEGFWVYVGKFLDWGNRWFGFIGWPPALWGLYEIIRRFRRWRRKRPAATPPVNTEPPTSAAPPVASSQGGHCGI